MIQWPEICASFLIGGMGLFILLELFKAFERERLELIEREERKDHLVKKLLKKYS